MKTQEIDWSLWDKEFMTAEIAHGTYVQVEDDFGDTFITPVEYFNPSDFGDNEPEFIKGFGVRL